MGILNNYSPPLACEYKEVIVKVSLRVLVVTSEWPSPDHPHQVPFIVQQVRFLQDRGIDISVFPFRGGKSLISYIKARRQLRHQYNLSSFDLIHIHFGQSAILVFPVRTPTIVTFWGSDVHGIVNQTGHYSRLSMVLRTISRWAAKQADEIIVVSSRMKALLGNPRHANLIPHGVDLDLFKPIPQFEARAALGLDKNTIYVLFAANENLPVKRHALAKEAVNKVNNKLECQLLTVTNATHDEMPLWMNAADCLLLTSRHEGSPTTVKEALACALPVVSVDVGDVSEQLEGIEGCHVCEADDSNTIADHLHTVLQQRQKISHSEKLHGLDENASIEAIIKVYRRVANQ